MTANRVLVCGTPRSGTTFAQRCLVEGLKGAVSGPETHAYSIGAGAIVRQLSARIRHGRRAGAMFYDAMWTRAGAAEGHAYYVVEKTPNHLRWLPSFLTHDGELVALIVEKPVAAATASLSTAAYAPRRIAAAYADVRFDRTITDASQRIDRERVQVIGLDALAADQVGSVAAVVGHWGFEPVAGDRVADTTMLVGADEPWKAESLEPGKPEMIRRSVSVLTAPQRGTLSALEHLHTAHRAASGRITPPLVDTLVVLGQQAPHFVVRSLLIRVKHLVVRGALGGLFLPPRRPTVVEPA